jgi:peroxiredoxin
MKIIRRQRVSTAVAIFIAIHLFLGIHVSTVVSAEKSWLGGLLGGGNSGKGPATDFEIQDLNGATVKLSQYKGEKNVLLYFWATWCSNCTLVKPDLIKIRHSIDESKLEVLGINVGTGDTLERLRKYQEANPVPWKILFDGDQKVTRSYKVQGIPFFVLIDKEGSVVYQGTMPPEDVQKLLKL